jgi:hypothetical protein
MVAAATIAASDSSVTKSFRAIRTSWSRPARASVRSDRAVILPSGEMSWAASVRE